MKEQLQSHQQNLRQQLQQLQQLRGPAGAERLRADSLDSSGVSERSDSDPGEYQEQGVWVWEAATLAPL